MKIAMLGATRGMGRAVARLAAQRGDSLFLLGRRPEELERSAGDLELRGAAGTVKHAVCDLLDPETFDRALDAADQSLGGIDALVISAGLFGTQAELEADRALAQRVLTADYTNTVLLCEAARPILLRNPRGATLAVFSSVAGERGRKTVGLYGSAKAGLTHYLESLDYRYRLKGLRVVTVKPGFVRTSMTDGLPDAPFATNADSVAPRILRAIDRGAAEIYAPQVWRLVMAAVRKVPKFAMRRLEF